jgi:hypothetical protein
MYELAGDSRAGAYFIALIIVGLAGAVGWGLKSLISPAGQPKNAIELGRRWAGWIVFGICVSMLSQFFGKLDLLSFIKFVVGLIWVPVAYGLGWGYGKFFKFKSAAQSPTTDAPNTSNQPTQPAHTAVHTDADESAIYAAIANELKSGNTDQGLWTRLFAECDGDENRTKALYIAQRARQLGVARPKINDKTILTDAKTPRFVVAAVVVLAVSAALIYSTQFVDKVEQPKYSAGDTWTFIDSEGTSVEELVLEARLTAEGVSQFFWKKGPSRLMGFDLPTPPGVRELRFPLSPAARWKNASDHDVMGVKVRLQEEFIVGEWEMVTVPAGTFRALRIDSTHVTTGLEQDGISNRPIPRTWWYSPKAKCMVKIMIGNKSTELKSYALKNT